MLRSVYTYLKENKMAIQEIMYVCSICGKRSKKEATIKVCEEKHSKDISTLNALKEAEEHIFKEAESPEHLVELINYFSNQVFGKKAILSFNFKWFEHVSNTHSAPKGYMSNWRKEHSIPTGYEGFTCWFSFVNEDRVWNLIERFMYLDCGGSSSAVGILWPQNFPKIWDNTQKEKNALSKYKEEYEQYTAKLDDAMAADPLLEELRLKVDRAEEAVRQAEEVVRQAELERDISLVNVHERKKEIIESIQHPSKPVLSMLPSP